MKKTYVEMTFKHRESVYKMGETTQSILSLKKEGSWFKNKGPFHFKCF